MAKEINSIMVTTGMTALASKELEKSVKVIKDAVSMERGSAWVIAQEYANIVESESYDDDFENLGQFADYMGVTKGLISQYKNAVAYITRPDSIFNANEISVVKAYTLSTLKEKDIDFICWCNSNERDIMAMSDNGLKSTIKEWKKELEAIEVTGEEVTAEEVTAEEVTDEAQDRAEALARVLAMIEQYNFTKEELGL